MSVQEFVARCPTCGCVSEHRVEGELYRCSTCLVSHDLLAGLA